MITPTYRKAFSAIPIAGSCLILIGILPTSATDEPTGTLSVSSALVRENTQPTLTWDITHPSNDIDDIVDVDPDGPITPKTDLRMDVRIIGASIGPSSNSWYPVQAKVAANGSSNFVEIFDNIHPEVDPTEIYFSTLVTEGNSNYFSGQFHTRLKTAGSGNFGTLFSTQSASDNIIILKNGQTPPTYGGFNGQSDVTTFLEPYITDGKIDIGPRDLIILFELFATSTSSSAFDIQDLVLLLTFNEVESN